MNAKRGDCIPKKSGVHTKLAARCTTKIADVSTGYAFPFDRTHKTIEIRIRMYKTVQTGPNTHPGGVSGGFSNC